MRRLLKCDKCRKPTGDTTVMILSCKAPCIGVKLCVKCARKFLRK